MIREISTAETWRQLRLGVTELEVSSLGRVRHLGKDLKAYAQTRGYLQVVIHRRKYTLARLVALAFLDDPHWSGAIVRYRDGDLGNCCAANLYWATHPRARWEGKPPRWRYVAPRPLS